MGARVVIGFAVLFVAGSAVAQCNSGDCQPGSIAGPYFAAQVAENTTGNYAICKSATCTSGAWNGQIEGIDARQNLGTSYQFFDQVKQIDSNIAVGPTVKGKNAQVLEWVDPKYVQAFDKVTGQPIFTSKNGTTAMPQGVSGKWSASTQPECQNSSGNVQVLFDRLDNEFVINRRVTYSVDGMNHYAWCIAVSSAADLSKATTKWYAYEYKMDSVIPCLPSSKSCTTGSVFYYEPDWPRIGTWSNGFYIAFDLADPTYFYEQAGVEACLLDRADIAKGGSTNPMVCYTYMVPNAQEPSLIHSLDVADIDSSTGPPSGEPEYFLGIVNPSNAQQGHAGTSPCTSKTTPCTSNQLALFSWGASGLTGPTLLSVNSYTPGCYDTSSEGSEVNTVCIPEPSTNPSDIAPYGSPSCYWFNTSCVDSLGDRMANRLTYNNLSSSAGGPNGAYLTASHVVMESTSDQRTGIRYYILQVSDGSASVVVNSGGTAGPPDLQDPNDVLFYFMPSAALDENGNLGITYSTSGAYCASCESQAHPAVNFVELPWGGLAFNTPLSILQGTGDEENTNNWGEYAATVIDSTDNLTFYGVGEYFDNSQTGEAKCTNAASDCFTWQNRIFRTQ
jgi:hypothetical protein